MEKPSTGYFLGMALLSSTVCRQRLQMYLDAEEKALNGQSYTIGGRTLTRANLKEIRDGITLWASRLKAAELDEACGRGGVRMMRTIPH